MISEDWEGDYMSKVQNKEGQKPVLKEITIKAPRMQGPVCKN